MDLIAVRAGCTFTGASIYISIAAKGSSPIKQMVKKGDIVHTWGGGEVNPSSLI